MAAMDTLFSSSTVAQIKDWQDLIGAIIGAFLAGFLALVSFVFGRYIKRRDELREALRQIEISNTYSLESTIQVQSKIAFFVTRLRRLITELRGITNPMEISYLTINFNPLGTIYSDNQTHSSKVRSYYLHNKLLIMHSMTSGVNAGLMQFQEDYAKIVRMNEFIIQVWTENRNPVSIRSQYADNLENFTNGIEEYSRELSNGIRHMTQIRVYNDKMRRKWGYATLLRWYYEGYSIKKQIELLEQIDKLIEPEVQAQIDKANARIAKLEAERKEKAE